MRFWLPAPERWPSKPIRSFGFVTILPGLPAASFEYRGAEWTTRGVSRVRRLALLDILARRSESA